MITNRLLLSLAAFLISLSAYAQEEASLIVQVRPFHLGNLDSNNKLFAPNESGEIQELELVPSNLPNPRPISSVNGKLVIYNKSEINPEKPEESIVASANLPAGIKSAIVILMPLKSDDGPTHRMLVINDSSKSFPWGSSLALNLISSEIAAKAGEHNIICPSGTITKIPMVLEVNSYGIAQTNFYHKPETKWTALSERQLQHFETYRRVFIFHVTPRAISPTITTIVDNYIPKDPDSGESAE